MSSARPAVRFVTDGYRRALGAMAATAFIGGTAEALFLVTVTRAAFAITGGSERVGVVAGWYLSVTETLVLAFALVLVRIAMAGLAGWQAARLAASAVARIRRQVARAFLDASWRVQQEQKAGSLQQVLGGYSSSAASLMGGIGGGALALANLAAMLGLAIALDPLGALFMLISVALLAVLLRPIRSVVQRRARAQNISSMELAVSTSEISQLGMELHIFNVQDQAQARLVRAIDLARDRARRLNFATGISSTVYVGMAYFALLAALAVVATSNATNLTSLGAVMLVMLRSMSYGQALQSAIVSVSSSTPSIEALMEHIDFFEKGRRTSGGDPVAGVDVMTFEHVTFRYGVEQAVLHDISFEISQHEVVGIIGPSGSGKSTLVQLLLGLREPQEGQVLADGRHVRSFDRGDWARKVTFVPQTPRLIAGSIADNIRFLRAGVTSADIERAARLAHLHDEIVGFEGGYERQVGAQGGYLSGGQQQRLCIARALVERPDVLILDEPTSALDVQSEHLIRTTLLGLKESMTVIVIAHRLTTVDLCDRIMVIQNGRLVGFDAPLRLAESNDFYRQALTLSGMR